MSLFQEKVVSITAVKALFNEYKGRIVYIQMAPHSNAYKILHLQKDTSYMDNSPLEKLNLKDGIELIEDRNEMVVAGKLLKFLSTIDYLTWRNFFLWISHKDSLFNVNCTVQNNNCINSLLIYNGVFEFTDWQKSLPHTKRDTDINTAFPLLSNTSSNPNECNKRAYYNTQYYLKKNWRTALSEGLLQETKPNEVFHVSILDTFFRLKQTGTPRTHIWSSNRNIFSVNNTISEQIYPSIYGVCAWPGNSKCLCRGIYTKDEELSYVDTNTPNKYLEKKKEALSELLPMTTILEEYYRIYINTYTQLADRVKNFQRLINRESEFLRKMLIDDNAKRVLNLSENILIRYLMDRVPIRLQKISQAYEKQPQNQPDAYSVTVSLKDGLYQVEFLAEAANECIFLFLQMHKKVFKKNNQEREIGLPIQYLIQTHHLSKYLLSSYINLEDLSAIDAIKPNINTAEEAIKAILIMAGRKEKKVSTYTSFTSLFVFASYLCTYLGYSLPKLLSHAIAFACKDGNDIFSCFYIILYIQRFFPTCLKIFSEKEVNHLLLQDNHLQNSNLKIYNELNVIKAILGIACKVRKKRTAIKMLLRGRPKLSYFPEWFFFTVYLLKGCFVDKNIFRFHQYTKIGMLAMQKAAKQQKDLQEISKIQNRYKMHLNQLKETKILTKKHIDDIEDFLSCPEELQDIEIWNLKRKNIYMVFFMRYIIEENILLLEHLSYLKQENRRDLPIYIIIYTMKKTLPFFVYLIKEEKEQYQKTFMFFISEIIPWILNICIPLKEFFEQIPHHKIAKILESKLKDTVCHIRLIQTATHIKNHSLLPNRKSIIIIKEKVLNKSITKTWENILSVPENEEPLFSYYTILYLTHPKLFNE